MTENEAKEQLESLLQYDLGLDEEIAVDMAIQALEEIQQYRAIGTVEEIKHGFNENRSAGYSHGYSDAIREFAERLIEELEIVVKQKAEEREHSLVNVSECDGMMLGLAVAIGIAKELADMKG